MSCCTLIVVLPANPSSTAGFYSLFPLQMVIELALEN